MSEYRLPGPSGTTDGPPGGSAERVAGEVEKHDPDVIRGIERVTGETYDRERDRWQRQPAGDDLADAQDVFLAASIAVWREIDRLDSRPEGYHPTAMDTELRKWERAAWERYRDLMDGRTERRAL